MRNAASAGTLAALLLAFLGKADVNSAEQPPDRSSNSGRHVAQVQNSKELARQPSGRTASFPLTAANQPLCSIVTLAQRGSSPLIDLAVESITGTVKRWSEVDLPLVEIGKNSKIPDDAGIVL